MISGSKITPNIMMRPIYGIPMKIVPQDGKFSRVPVKGKINQYVDFPDKMDEIDFESSLE
jgi:hypothetical protein